MYIHKIVVLPALSRPGKMRNYCLPKIRILNSFFPNKLLKSFEKTNPIFKK